MTEREIDVPTGKAGSCSALSMTQVIAHFMGTRKSTVPGRGKQRYRELITRSPNNHERAVSL